MIIVLSGGCDPIHVGHLRMFKAAFKYNTPNFVEAETSAPIGNRVFVLLNSDEWLMRKKGYVFMPFEERKELIEAYGCVEKVLPVDDSDDSVVKGLEKLYWDLEEAEGNFVEAFGNGGDRTDKNTPEKQFCEEQGIDLIWGLGGGKVQSSSELVKQAKDKGMT